MKLYHTLPLLLFTFLFTVGNAQHNQWTWVTGDSLVGKAATYGRKGLASSYNNPAAKQNTSAFTDSAGNFWLFGGYGRDGSNSTGSFNDLWKYDIQTGLWTWINGDSTINNPGVYGTKGTASPSNIPGGRGNAMSWTDTNGVFWLFGGQGYDPQGNYGFLNDLWKYEVNTGMWTWVSGDSTLDLTSTYGTQGVSSPSNIPGGRSRCVNWIDDDNNLWIFGGIQYAASSYSRLNDLWKYNTSTNEWTWVNGSSSTNQSSVYGTQGIAASSNVPGARTRSICWKALNGDFWLFGGYGYDENHVQGYQNDLWRWDGTNWTWIDGNKNAGTSGVYGTQGVASSSNLPGGRNYSASWTDNNGNFYLHGGFGKDAQGGKSNLNDLWKWDGTNWTWVSGDSIINANGTFTNKGIADPSSMPGAIYGTLANWKKADNTLWFWGGYGYSANGDLGYLNNMWKYDVNSGQWTWVAGDIGIDTAGFYGTKGGNTPFNTPGPRYGAVSWKDTNNTFWLFGGYGNNAYGHLGSMNDLWQYNGDIQAWIWMSGADSTRNEPGVYGTKGISGSSNTPGARRNAVTWVDPNNNLWLFGGSGYEADATSGRLNDLWKFDISTKEWTWMSGSDTVDQAGDYGSKGISSSSNAPGGRYSATGLVDASGNLWLYGGNGVDAFGSKSSLNDLWKYDISSGEWTWVSGGNSTSQSSTFGTMGTPSSSNKPGVRYAPIGWIDNNDNIWIFGGFGKDGSSTTGYLNELWRYSVSSDEWTWMGGSKSPNQYGTYGDTGVYSVNNIPGARHTSAHWVDEDNNLCLFGGRGYDGHSGSYGYLSDFWKYNTTINQWVWISGNDKKNEGGTHGSKGTASYSITPDGRYDMAYWADDNNNLWIFGGQGYDATNSSGYFNDLLKYTPTPTTTWDGSSWSNGVPTNEMDATIASATEYGTFGCKNIIVNDANQLSVEAPNTVTITGAVYNAGNGFGGNGTISFDNDGATLELNGKSIEFEGVISVEGTTTLQTNDSLTLTASDTAYGMLLGDGNVSGNVTAQTWLNLAGGSNDARYYHLGSPFTNAKLSDFNEGSIMVSANTNQGTTWEWDASTAEWTAAGSGSLSSNAQNGLGYAIYAGTNTYGTFLRDSAGTLELTGNVTNSDVSVSLDYNDGQASSVSFVGGSTTDDTEGWNMLSNPYPAQYDWNSPSVPSDLSSAKYVWNGLAYESYNNGVGSGDRYIPPFQAFFVQLTNDPGSSVNFSFEAAKRTSGQSLMLKSASVIVIDGIDVSVDGPQSYIHDEFYLGFDNNSTVLFDNSFDARKLQNSASVPNFYVELNGTKYSICRVNHSGPTSFPVKLDYANHGEAMSISADLSRLQSFSSVILEDRKKAVFHHLSGGGYSFTHDSTFADRFYIHFGQNAVSLVEQSNEHVVYAWKTEQGISVETGTLENAQVEVFNTGGQLVTSLKGTGTIDIPVNLHGVYLIRVTHQSFAKTLKVIY